MPTRDHDKTIRLQILASTAALAVLVLFGCTDFGSGVPPVADDGGHNGGPDTVTVSFSTQVLPIFQANCAGTLCHSPCVSSNGAGLCLVSYATTYSGGAVIPGDAQNSLMVQRLEGRRTPRMPRGRPALNDSLIQLIRTWIDEGARDN
jgi:hypothetical protein